MNNEQNNQVNVHEHHVFVHGTEEFFDKQSKRSIGTTIKLLLTCSAAISVISVVVLVLSMVVLFKMM